MDVLAAQVGGALKSHGLMLATAESCTGGGVAQAITDVAGSSAWFERGFRYLLQSVQAADAGSARDDAQSTRRGV